MRYTHPALLEHLASAYVLGTLSGGARRRFVRLMNDRTDVQLLVAQWEGRLGALASSVSAQQPPQRVWAAIEARTRPRAASAGSGRALPKGEGAAAPWVRWGVLQGLAGLAVGVAVTVALVVAVPTLFVSSDQVALRAGDKLPQAYVGLLTDAAGNGKVLVSSLRHGRTLTVKVIGPITLPATSATSATAGPAAGSAPQLVLWAVPAQGAPFALGTVPVMGSAVSALPDTSENLLLKVSKLMVTLETSTTPQVPGGTVLFTGDCAKLW